MPSQKANPPTAGNTDVIGQKRWELTDLTDATLHVSGAITATGATDYYECAYATTATITIDNGAANSVIATPEGSVDGVTFYALAYKVLGSTTVVAGTAKTTTAGTKEALVLQDIPNVRFVRMNVGTANANGTTFRVFLADI